MRNSWRRKACTGSSPWLVGLVCATVTLAIIGCTPQPTPAPTTAPTSALTTPTTATASSGTRTGAPFIPGTTEPSRAADPSRMPRLAHVVIVVMENHSAGQVLHNPAAPFLESLTISGLTLTDMHAITHPSQPNYLALFAGSTYGVSSDACPIDLSGPNLASELAARGYSFAGYSEGLPAPGYRGCSAGEYARKHNPWSDFRDLPAVVNQPLTAFPSDFSRLPTVSFVVPNLLNDMHDGTITQADTWLARHLGTFATWATQHQSLLIITWDENEGSVGNQIATILVGAGILPGTDSQNLTHLSLLRTLEDAYGLPHLGATAATTPILATWQ